MMAKKSQLHCSVITPERAVLETDASFIAVPAHDGEIGIATDRAPLVAKLGVGELRVESPGGDAKHYLIDGGFVQVLNNEVSVLTSKATPVEDLSRATARTDLDAALHMPNVDELEHTMRENATDRARAALRLAKS